MIVKRSKYKSQCTDCGKVSEYNLYIRSKCLVIILCKECAKTFSRQIEAICYDPKDELKEIEDLVKGGFKNDN